MHSFGTSTQHILLGAWDITPEQGISLRWVGHEGNALRFAYRRQVRAGLDVFTVFNTEPKARDRFVFKVLRSFTPNLWGGSGASGRTSVPVAKVTAPPPAVVSPAATREAAPRSTDVHLPAPHFTPTLSIPVMAVQPERTSTPPAVEQPEVPSKTGPSAALPERTLRMVPVAFTGDVLEGEDIAVVVDGSRVRFDGGTPYLQGEAVMIPLEALARAGKFTYRYDAASQKLDVREGMLVLVLGSRTAIVQGERRRLMGPAEICNGVLAVPMDFAALTLSGSVRWDPSRRTVMIIVDRQARRD